MEEKSLGSKIEVIRGAARAVKRNSSRAVNFMGHCCFCLTRINPEKETGDVSNELEKIKSLQQVWPYLVDRDRAGELEQFSFVYEKENGTNDCSGMGVGSVLTKLPPICGSCANLVLELHKLHWELNSKVEELKKVLADNSNSSGFKSVQLIMFERMLRASNLDPSTIKSTFEFLHCLQHSSGDGRHSADAQPQRVNEDWNWKLDAKPEMIEILIDPLQQSQRFFAVNTSNSLSTSGAKLVRNQDEFKESDTSGVKEMDDAIKEEVISDEEEGFVETAEFEYEGSDDSSSSSYSEYHSDDLEEYEARKVTKKKPSLTKRGRKRKIKQISTNNKKLSKLDTQMCNVCKAGIPIQEIYAHMRTHVQDFAEKCPNPECLRVYSNPRSLHRDHLLQHPNCKKVFMQNGFVCESCGKQFFNGATFRAHLDLHESAIKTKTIDCPFPECKMQFAVRQSVGYHIFNCHTNNAVRQRCFVCMKLFGVDAMEAHLREEHENEEVTKCPQCPFVFPGWNHLIRHMKFHYRSKDGLACAICTVDGVRFNKFPHLKEHYFKEHQIGEQYVCDHCQKSFPTKATLSGHVKYYHSEKRFKCDQCDHESFDKERKLASHKIKCHGGKPLPCMHCSKTFLFPASLTAHFKKEHDVNRDSIIQQPSETFTCSVDGCGKIYKQKRVLFMHEHKSHGLPLNPKIRILECEICSEQFLRGDLFRKHMNFHAGIKKICEVCGEGFSSAETVRKHQLIHTGERPFTCEICGQAFRQKEVLGVHLKSHEKLGVKFKPKGPQVVRKRIKRQ